MDPHEDKEISNNECASQTVCGAQTERGRMPMDLNKKNMKNIMLLIVFAVLFYIGVQKIESVAAGIVFIWHLVFPFILGGTIAFILNVPMHALENRLFGRLKEKGRAKKLARPASLILSILLVIVIIWVVLVVLIPEIGSTIVSLSRQIELAIPRMQKWFTDNFQANPLIEDQINSWFNSLEVNWDQIIQTGIDFLRNGAGNVLGTTFNVAVTLINSVMNFVIGFVFACYILLQKEKLSVQIRKALYAFLPAKAVRQVLKVASLSYKTFSSFVTGQCLEAVILGTMFFVIMSILQFPYALLVGVVIACTALIPIFGAFIGCVVGAFLILVVNPMRAVAFVILFLVLQQIEGNLIYPHVVGNSVGLPSIWVLMAVTVGGNLMGVVGMLVFIPLTSILYALFRQTVHKRLKERKIHDI